MIDRFGSRKVDESAAVKIERVRASARGMASTIETACPASREASLAMTNLEQAAMWAVKAISHDPSKTFDPVQPA